MDAFYRGRGKNIKKFEKKKKSKRMLEKENYKHAPNDYSTLSQGMNIDKFIGLSILFKN